MKKIDAIIEVLRKKGKVIAVSKNTGRFMSYGTGESIVWCNSAELVACCYMNTDKFKIQEVEK